MFRPEDIELLRSKLKNNYRSPVKVLVDETGYTRTTISKFFNHHHVNPETGKLIYRIGTRLIQKAEEEKNSLVQNLKDSVSGKTPHGKQASLNLQ